jgi:transposase
MRSGVQWNQLPAVFGPDSTVHGWFQRFVSDGVLGEIWAEVVRECDELGGVSWEWQAADGVMGKSRFAGDKRGPKHLCLDKAYDNKTGGAACAAGGYVPHIRRIGEEKLDGRGNKAHPARRWVVERTLAWLQRCRAILIRYDKKSQNHLGIVQLACTLLWYRRLHTLNFPDGVLG